MFARWEYFISGPPLTQIAEAEPLAGPGQTVVSSEAWVHIAHVAKGTPLVKVDRQTERERERERKKESMREKERESKCTCGKDEQKKSEL